jgi:hypothetical protein
VRERELRRRCRRLLNELDIRPPLDVTEPCRRLGAKRGKPIRLVEHPIPVPGPFGFWIATETADYILYQQHTSKSHQHHIVLHEIGHILEWASVLDRVVGRVSTDATAERMGTALGDRLGWL